MSWNIRYQWQHQTVPTRSNAKVEHYANSKRAAAKRSPHSKGDVPRRFIGSAALRNNSVTINNHSLKDKTGVPNIKDSCKILTSSLHG